MLALWLALVGASIAGPREVTLNGVDIGALRDQRFVQVDVWIDAEGRVHLTSDRYEVQVDDVEGADDPAPADPIPPAAPQDPAAGASQPGSTDAPEAPGTTPSNTVTAAAPGAGTARPARVTPEPGQGAGVPPGSWWLATEDNGSRGHEARVYVNGTLVRTVRSGEPQVILDVSRHLHPGENQVMVQTRSLSPAGGGFYVYVGEGSNAGGTVTLEQPEVQHGLGPSRRGDHVQEYTIVVD